MASSKFIIFILVGLVCAVIDVGLMQLLIWSETYYLVATTMGFVAGFAANFLLHARVTFGKDYSHQTLVRFMAVVLVNYILTMLIVSLFQALFDMPLLGKIASLPVVAINGFLLSKHWVFK